ncbi:MAG: hypothetical protein ACE361_13615 [Aureliella sp.]
MPTIAQKAASSARKLTPKFYSPVDLLHNAGPQESSKVAGNRPRQPFGWSLAAAFICCGWASIGLRESLWLDELHTSWSISGDWSEISFRARAGNQSPVYMWLVKVFDWTLGMSGQVSGGVGASFSAAEAAEGYLPKYGPSTEILLRLPSLLAYGVTVAVFVWICLRRAAEPHRGGSHELRASGRAGAVFLALVSSCALLGLDRIQLFYATEARVYSLLQMLGLLGWCCIYALFRRCATVSPACEETSEASSAAPSESGARAISAIQNASLYVWTSLAVSMVYLHLISVIVLMVQAAALVCVLLWYRQSGLLKRFAFCLVAFSVICIPAGWLGLPVWERRSQWNRFAGDASFQAVLNQFPVLPILIPVLVAALLERAFLVSLVALRKLRGGVVPAESTKSHLNKDMAGLWIWAIAFAGPLLIGWALTVFEVAPVMHRRYLLASSVPLALCATWLLVSLRSRWLAVLALVASVGWLIVYQPTLDVWRAGQLQGTLRGEDWRGAAEWIAQRIKRGDEIWCGSDLIEGDGLELPIDIEMDRYLAFPLAGHYSVAASSMLLGNGGAIEGEAAQAVHPKAVSVIQPRAVLAIQPKALLSNAGLWLQQWFSAVEPEGERVLTGDCDLFVVVRAPAEDLASVMEAIVEQRLPAELKLSVVGPIQRFGLLSGVRLRIKRPGF